MLRLKELRARAGVTQDVVAAHLGVARVTYTKWETEDREPDFETLKKLAEYFNTSTSYIIGETDDPSPPGASKGVSLEGIEFALYGEIRDLTEREKEIILRNAQTLKELRKGQAKE